jgi:hypothetical protein
MSDGTIHISLFKTGYVITIYVNSITGAILREWHSIGGRNFNASQTPNHTLQMTYNITQCQKPSNYKNKGHRFPSSNIRQYSALESDVSCSRPCLKWHYSFPQQFQRLVRKAISPCADSISHLISSRQRYHHGHGPRESAYCWRFSRGKCIGWENVIIEKFRDARSNSW